MENGWMDWIEWMWMWKVESGCGLSGCGGWRGSGSHTTLEGKFEWTPFIVHVILIKKTIYAEKYAERERGERWKFSVKYNLVILGGKLEFGWDYMYNAHLGGEENLGGYNNRIYSSIAKHTKP